jgi:ABC-type Na+ transport system ATPase subunit NatA
MGIVVAITCKERLESFLFLLKIDEAVKKSKIRRHSKKLQLQGTQIRRNEAYFTCTPQMMYPVK